MQTFTITFGECAENNVNMQQIGHIAYDGFTLDDLQQAKQWFDKHDITTDLINIHDYLPEVEQFLLKHKNKDASAYILIARKGLNAIVNSNDFFTEQNKLTKDKQVLYKGKVVNKTARYNLCFDDFNQEPDYENGKGRIVSFNDLPLLNEVRIKLENIIGTKAANLVAEGNYYYDITKCGIGFHGDTERKRVIGVRVGADLPLHYQWYKRNQPIGDRCELLLGDGDIYFMSEKATGFDWKKENVALRHAAGANKFLQIC